MTWGFRTKGWKGAPWAPIGLTYVPRRVWVIEQWPKDPYYNWGLHINYVDKETYSIYVKEVYDKAGQFHTWMMTFYHYEEAPSGNNIIGYLDGAIPINERIRHALPTPASFPDRRPKIFLPSSKIKPDYFTMSNFLQLSK